MEATNETLRFETADGVTLEGDLAVGPSPPAARTQRPSPPAARTQRPSPPAARTQRPAEPWAAVVLAHPHPQMGGDRHSLVTSELFRALPQQHVATLRFDFRGAGGSEGAHGGGEAEVQDVQAAVDLLADRVPGVPLVVAGWSFGADTALGVLDERLAGWFALALPFRFGTHPAAGDPRPKLLAIPEHDQIAPPSVAYGEAEDWVNTRLEVVPGADHLCAGRTDHVAELLVDFLRSTAADDDTVS